MNQFDVTLSGYQYVTLLRNENIDISGWQEVKTKTSYFSKTFAYNFSTFFCHKVTNNVFQKSVKRRSVVFIKTPEISNGCTVSKNGSFFFTFVCFKIKVIFAQREIKSTKSFINTFHFHKKRGSSFFSTQKLWIIL